MGSMTACEYERMEFRSMTECKYGVGSMTECGLRKYEFENMT